MNPQIRALFQSMGINPAMAQSMDPQTFMQQMASQNPVIAKAMQMIQGKSPEEIMQVASNLAQSQGVTLDQVRQQLGV